LGLKCTGRKAELVERLAESLRSNDDHDNNDNNDDDDDIDVDAYESAGNIT